MLSENKKIVLTILKIVSFKAIGFDQYLEPNWTFGLIMLLENKFQNSNNAVLILNFRVHNTFLILKS